MRTSGFLAARSPLCTTASAWSSIKHHRLPNPLFFLRTPRRINCSLPQRLSAQHRRRLPLFPTAGAIIPVFLAIVSIPGVWRFTRKIAADVDSTTVSLLPADPNLQMSSFSQARRYAFWFLAVFFHSINTIFCVRNLEPDLTMWRIKCTCSVIILLISIALFVLLRQKFPITRDFLVVGGCFGIFYLLAVMVATSSQYTVLLELIHIPITLFVNILRFSCQLAFLQFDWLSFSIAIMGTIQPFLPLVQDYHLSAYKIAALIGGLFRGCDAFFIMGLGNDKANLLLIRLQEFLLWN